MKIRYEHIRCSNRPPLEVCSRISSSDKFSIPETSIKILHMRDLFLLFYILLIYVSFSHWLQLISWIFARWKAAGTAVRMYRRLISNNRAIIQNSHPPLLSKMLPPTFGRSSRRFSSFAIWMDLFFFKTRLFFICSKLTPHNLFLKSLLFFMSQA